MAWPALAVTIASLAVSVGTAIADAVRGRSGRPPLPEPVNPRHVVEEAREAAEERARRGTSSGGLLGAGRA